MNPSPSLPSLSLDHGSEMGSAGASPRLLLTFATPPKAPRGEMPWDNIRKSSPLCHYNRRVGFPAIRGEQFDDDSVLNLSGNGVKTAPHTKYFGNPLLERILFEAR